MANLANLVRVTSATTGTGTLTLGSAVQGFLTPSQAGMLDGQPYSYAIEATYTAVGDDLIPFDREVGTGTYTASGGTLTRTVLKSTNGNAALNLTGDEQVIITPVAGSNGELLANVDPSAAQMNLVINGAMEVFQDNLASRTTGVATGTTFCCDMFAYVAASTAAVVNLTQATDGPVSPNGLEWCQRVAVTTADTSIAAGDVAYLRTAIEGYQFARMGFGAANATSVSVSFWVKAHRTGTYCVGLTNSARNRTYIQEFTVNSADTWEYKTFTFPGDTSGTWLADNGVGAYITWAIASGSTFQQAAGSWGATASAVATSNQVNGVGATTDVFSITGVWCVPGTNPVPQAISHLHRPFGLELTLCQRYWEKSFDYATGPAQNVDSSFLQGLMVAIQLVTGASGNRSPIAFAYKVKKRTGTPTTTIYNPAAANAQFRNIDTALDCTSSLLFTAGEYGLLASYTSTTGAVVGNRIAGHWTSDARI